MAYTGVSAGEWGGVGGGGMRKGRIEGKGEKWIAVEIENVPASFLRPRTIVRLRSGTPAFVAVQMGARK